MIKNKTLPRRIAGLRETTVQEPKARNSFSANSPHEPSRPPTGLGVRQPPGALEVVGGPKRQRTGARKDAAAPNGGPPRNFGSGPKARNSVSANSPHEPSLPPTGLGV